MKYLVFFTLLILFGCSSASTVNSQIQKIDQLHKPVHLAEIKKIFGSLSVGHGSYMSVELKGNKKEMWFWFLPSEEAKSEQFEEDSDQFEVSFITIGIADDPDSQQIVWPKKYVGLPLEKVSEDVYRILMKDEARKAQ